MIHGFNPLASGLLAFELQKKSTDFERFRDAYLKRDGDDIRIIVLTRTGGGNREDYEDNWSDIRSMAGYLCDYDDEFDPTFALIEFAVPADSTLPEQVAELLAASPEAESVVFPPSLRERTHLALDAMSAKPSEVTHE